MRLRKPAFTIFFEDERFASSARLLLGAGFVLRIGWAALRHTSGATGEAKNVAVAIAEGRGIADAFRVGQGATAHLLPISPTLAGAIYSIFGIRSALSECILAVFAISMALGSYVLLLGCFKKLGVTERVRLGVLAFLCVMPTYFNQEAVDFRVWDGGLAVLASSAFLYLLIGSLDAPATIPREAGMALLAAFLFFVNPIPGAAAYLCLAAYAWQRMTIPATVRCGAMAFVGLALFITPWTMRNQRLFGHTIPLRSNGGLELALGTNPAMLTTDDRGGAFFRKIYAIHPALSDTAYRSMQAMGGEQPYAKYQQAIAIDWIRQHPVDEMRLIALHVRDTVLPENWNFAIWESAPFAPLRSLLASLVGALGVAGLATALYMKRRNWLFPMIFVLVPIMLVAPFQPVSRYNYLIYPLMTFFAAEFLALAAVILERAYRAVPKLPIRGRPDAVGAPTIAGAIRELLHR